MALSRAMRHGVVYRRRTRKGVLIMSEEEYREFGQSVADELYDAAGRGASLSEMMDMLDDSCFDGDICEFL